MRTKLASLFFILIGVGSIYYFGTWFIDIFAGLLILLGFFGLVMGK